MAMTISMSGHDSRRRTSLPLLSLGNGSASKPLSGTSYLTDQERAAFIVPSSTRRPSLHNLYPSPCSYSPPSSVASSPGELGRHRLQHGSTPISPILTPFLWTSDLHQYIMADIGPQPSNSQMPSIRSQSHLVRHVSSSKISPVAGCGNTAAVTATASHSNHSTDLCTIRQDEVLPPMDVPLEGRFAHQEWDDD
ncbi:MAG: hypothetical protein J3Q66DRAFT_321825, partial [Benniella sp.]